MNSMARFGFGVVLLAALAVTGCYAHARPAYVEAEVAPVDIEVYPSTYYEGRTVYLVGDRWYTRRHNHWVYYSVEPEPLYRYRARVQRAPHAPHRHEYRHHRGRGHYRESAPGYAAPPARRVR